MLANYVGTGFIIFGACVSAFILTIISGAYFEIKLPQEWIDYIRFYETIFRG